ncbi:glycosyltransferase family 4 protein [Cellulomonas sp. Sa3CUA2]|uniref:Glycosyltransferase family 4 protein n=1 Tax=Cellulomonas avistercoris TaxID=2762242 RepID=A0ABR8QIG1_9CELL|nr:glycosyltransferase family 1 protein [Cellulomonas avistercoris]MBD7920216.1 glycosyltransferase family 4 protein [Cellulomonas avistercoris]
MTLRALVDATAVPADRGGVGRYVDNLVPALARTGTEVVVAVVERDAEVFAGAGVRVQVVRGLGRRSVRMAWEQVGLPSLARRVRADVVHSPHYTRPLVLGVPSVVTLHDATFFSHPELHTGVKRTFFRTATRLAVRRADALVVPSAATRDEIVRFVGARPEQFHVAHHGVDPQVFHPVERADVAEVARELGLDGPYVAFLGTLEPRKNVPALVRAWTQVAATLPEPPALVLAGARGWDDEVTAACAAVPAGLRLVVPGYLPVGSLAPLLAGADVVAYPSLGEGFGLPVLEAMASGGCVLTTRELSLPEVGGDAVAYCGTSSAAIADGLASLLADPDRRERLRAAAVERAALFTWDAAARAHVAAFESAVQAQVRPPREVA